MIYDLWMKMQLYIVKYQDQLSKRKMESIQRIEAKIYDKWRSSKEWVGKIIVMFIADIVTINLPHQTTVFWPEYPPRYR